MQQLSAKALANELMHGALQRLQRLAESPRGLNLPEFGPAVRREVQGIVLEKFPRFDRDLLANILSAYVVVTEARIKVDFERMAAAVQDPSSVVLPRRSATPLRMLAMNPDQRSARWRSAEKRVSEAIQRGEPIPDDALRVIEEEQQASDLAYTLPTRDHDTDPAPAPESEP